MRFTKYIFAAAAYARLHPVISGAAAIVILGGGWWAWGTTGSAAPVRYVLGTAATSTIVASIQESGQVASSNTLTITPQVSGQILSVNVKPGQHVAAGTLIAEIDPVNAQKSLRDAQAQLASAKLSLQKLTQPATALSAAQTQDAVVSAQSSLNSTYSQSASDLANTFLDMPSIMTGLQDVDFGTETNKAGQWNIDWYENGIAIYDTTNAQAYRAAAFDTYQTAKASYDKTSADYQKVNIASAGATSTSQLLGETYTTLNQVLNAAKAANTLIQFYSDKLSSQNLPQPAVAASQITSLASYTSKLASHSASLFSDTAAIASGIQSLNEKELSLAQLQQGADALDIASAQLSVQSAQNSVTDAQVTLAEYYVRAPFAGTIGSVAATPYSQGGSGTALATLVTSQQYAQLSVNEVDAAKLVAGQRATLTFDAIPDLTLTGSVAQIDQVGAVSQGVVSYNVKIGFDSQDPRIKPGMTANAGIQTGVAEDVLAVPQTAVKTVGGQTFVQVFNPPVPQASIDAAGTAGVTSAVAPIMVPVTTGLSDDTNIEITSGLVPGQQIVVSTRSGAQATASTAARSTSAFGGAGGGGARGGGALRIGG